MLFRPSLTLIVKNEAATLARSLTSIRDIVDEIVVVDTGSSDHSKDIALQPATDADQVWAFCPLHRDSHRANRLPCPCRRNARFTAGNAFDFRV